jgi:hypothetical protein
MNAPWRDAAFGRFAPRAVVCFSIFGREPV